MNGRFRLCSADGGNSRLGLSNEGSGVNDFSVDEDMYWVFMCSLNCDDHDGL